MTERKASMGDKVYRGDVVKFIRNNISLGTFMKRTVKTADEACWDLCDKLNYVPAIEEKNEPHWIPVTERLPEVGESVLICDAYGDICIGHRTRSGYYFPDFCDDKIKDVRAWAELPEPYKGVTE